MKEQAKALVRKVAGAVVRQSVKACDHDEHVAEMLGLGPCKRCVGQAAYKGGFLLRSETDKEQK